MQSPTPPLLLPRTNNRDPLTQEQKLQTPQQQLRLLTGSLTHEALSVRAAALGELHTFLLRHPALVGELTSGASEAQAGGRLLGMLLCGMQVWARHAVLCAAYHPSCLHKHHLT